MIFGTDLKVEYVPCSEGAKTDCKLAYHVFHSEGNTKATIYCFAGMGDLRHQYRYLAQVLTKKGFRLVCADLRGHGDSSFDGITEYTPEVVAQDYRDLMKASPPQGKVLLAGNSFAGCAAVSVPNETTKIDGIILLGAVLRPATFDKVFYPLSFLLFNNLWGISTWLSYYSTLYIQKPSDFDEYKDLIRSKMVEGRITAVGKLARASKAEAEKKLTNLKVPTIAFYGDKDPDFPSVPKEVEWLQSILSSNNVKHQVTLFQNVSHYPHVEKAEVIATSIEKFFE